MSDRSTRGRRRRSSMRDVAEMAGVAVSSVSRVLSGHPGVSPQIRDQVLAAVHKLGYRPDFLAQSLRRGATQSIGFIGDISNPLVAAIVTGAEEVLRASDYSMLLMNSENKPSLDVSHIRFFEARRVDGMILSLASMNQATRAVLAATDLPCVILDREPVPGLGISVVRSDHRSGMFEAVSYLLDFGHRRIALVTGPNALWSVSERIIGMRNAIASRGLPDQTLVLNGSLSAEHGIAATESLLAMRPRPTAIIAGGNQVLAGCATALVRHKVRIPEQISLVACDQVALTELFSPPIASVYREIGVLGRIASELLLERLEADQEPKDILLPTHFRPRESVGRAQMDEAAA